MYTRISSAFWKCNDQVSTACPDVIDNYPTNNVKQSHAKTADLLHSDFQTCQEGMSSDSPVSQSSLHTDQMRHMCLYIHILHNNPEMYLLFLFHFSIMLMGRWWIILLNCNQLFDFVKNFNKQKSKFSQTFKVMQQISFYMFQNIICAPCMWLQLCLFSLS